MRVTVRLFARLRDIAGSGDLSREAPAGATVGDVWRALVAEFPEMARYESSMSSAVNADYAQDDGGGSGRRRDRVSAAGVGWLIRDHAG